MCNYHHQQCLCPPGAECVDTDAGKQCVVQQSGNSLMIEDPTVTNVVSIENTINTLLEDAPVSNRLFYCILYNYNYFQSSSAKRRKREGFVTVCSGYLIQLSQSSKTYMLVWVCPDESQPPDDEKLYKICQTIIQLQLAKVCYPPKRSPIALNEVPPSK